MRMWSFVLVAVLLSPAGALAQPSLAISDGRTVEGNGGTRTVELVVTATPAAQAPATVTWTTRAGTAGAGDFRSATGTLSLAPGAVAQRISVDVIGDTVDEPNEAFEVLLQAPSGASLGDASGTVTIVDDDDPASGGLATYEVRFTYTGVRGTLASSPDCPVRPTSRAVMTGLLSGTERGARSDDDLVYTGALHLDVDIDLCHATRAPGSSEDRLCVLRVVGVATVMAELVVEFGDRGGYVQNERAPGTSVLAHTSGSCDAMQTTAERAMIPDDTEANVFNGESIPALPSGPLRPGARYVENAFVFEVLRRVR